MALGLLGRARLTPAPAMVQRCTVFTVLELRRALGLSQVGFAKHLGIHKNSVINWERGYVYPSAACRLRMRSIARAHGLTKTTEGPLPIRHVSVVRMAQYEKPKRKGGTGQQRAQYLSQRAKYRALLADAQAGRVHLE